MQSFTSCPPKTSSTLHTCDHPIPPSPCPPPPSPPHRLSTGSTLPLPLNNPISYSNSDRGQFHHRVSSTISESKQIHLHPQLLHNKHDYGYAHYHTHRRSQPESNQEARMTSPLEQQQQEKNPQQWNQPSGTTFAEGGLPLWKVGTVNSRSLRNPFVKSFGLRHKATMDWGMRARARTQRHWDKYWHQVETGQESSFDNLYEIGNFGTGEGTGAGTSTGASTDVSAGGSGGPGGDDSKAPGGETIISASPDTISDTYGASTSSQYKCTSVFNCTQNSNLDTDNRSNSIDESYSTATTTTAMKDNGLARAETELPFSPDMIAPLPGDNDGPGSLFFLQLLNHYQKSPRSQDPSTYFPSTYTDNNTSTHNTNTTFRQYYQINREFYKPGGPIILWLPGESPLHSLFLRRGLAYELANATTGLLVALEHRFYGNSIPRFQDSPAAHKDDSLIFDAGREKQELPPLSTPSDLMSDPEYPLRHMTAPTPRTEDDEEGEVEHAGGVWISARSLASSTSPNSGPTKFNHQIGVDKASRARIKGRKHGNLHGDKQQNNPPPPHNQTDNVHHGNNTNNDSIREGEKEGLPLDLLKYLNVDQSIEDIARFMDLFPTLQPKLFPIGESDPVTASSPPSKPRWILAGCSYGGNLAAWTRQRYPSKVFAAFASSAPVRSALDFFEYSTLQIDILGDKCSRQLGLARDFLDGALQMTDGFMQQMTAVDLETKQQTAAGIISPTDSTGQEQGRTVAAMGDFDDFSSSAVTATDPMPVVGENDKAHRQAAKLRVLSWFSPDFAREYAAEGEEFHAAGWVWWTVASAVQYNAVVTPSTVQPARTAVDILCDAMDIAKDDGLTGVGSSNNNNSSNNSTRSQLKSLQYTKALASWFKDQQYFTPTKQEDLQPSDLDPTSVQNLAGIAWLWQTCSELGYLQTAHPSTCCCPSRAGSSSLSQFLDTSEDFTISTSPTATIEQGSNATCPFIPGNVGSTFYSSTFFPFPEGSSSSLHQPAAATDNSILPPPSASVSTPTTSTTPGSTTTGSTCLPCRCYADEAQRSESVFSRLLTLEAAWQECQFYFGSTHPPARNPIARTSSSPPSSSPSPSSLSASSKETTVVEAPVLNPVGALEGVYASATTTTTSRQRGQSPGGRGPPGDIQQCVAVNPGTGTTQQDEKRDDVLLLGYPDVETNVNTKFHGWEIAQDPCYPSGDVNHSIETGSEYINSNNNNPLSDEFHSGSSSTTTSTSASGTTVTSAHDLVAADAAASPLYGPEIAEEGVVVEQKRAEDNTVGTRDGFPRIVSELDDWLVDHPGGRYYFTNGEKDPWKELTLANSRALEFLSRPKVGSGSGSGSNSNGNDVRAGGKKQSRKRVSSKQDSAAQVAPLDSADALESASPSSIEIGRGGGSTGGLVVPQDAVEDIEDEDPVVVEEPSLAPAPTAETTSTSTLQRDSRSHRKGKHHRHHHHRHHHRRRHHPRKHHHHHHHRKHHTQHHRHKRQPKRPVCTQSPVDPCQWGPLPALISRRRRDIGTSLSQPKLPEQDEDIAGENGGSGSDGSTVISVEVDEDEKEDGEQQEEDKGTPLEGNGNNRIRKGEYGDRTVMRIISEASHCQDILYESSDHNSVNLRAEREHVLRTFVRWIEIDNRRVQRALERRQQQQQ